MADSLRSTVAYLSGEHERLSALLETMGEGVLVVDRVGAVELANSSARTMLSVGGRARGETMHRLHDPDLIELTRAAASRKKRMHQEVQLLPGPVSVSAVATPLERERVLLTLHDLTPVRRLAVTRREFVSNVSHELRNPLAAMTALVETLENGAVNDPEAAANFLGRVRNEIERMTALVNDLLTLSRVESGRDEFYRTRVELGPLLDDARTASLPKAAEGVEVTLEGEGATAALADPHRLRQVVDNLLDNALRFTPAGGRVALRCWAEDDRAHFSVADTGPGIEREHLPHIFERFYKADRSRQDPGTGLGLAIARHIVVAHGGSISVESVPNEGTTFEVVLPSHRDETLTAP